MKNNTLHKILTGAFAFVLFSSTSFGQTDLPPFDKLDLNGRVTVTLIQGEPQQVRVTEGETKKLEMRVEGSTLVIDASNCDEDIKVTIATPTLNSIKMSSIAEIRTNGTFNTPELFLEMEGASEAILNIKSQTIRVDLSGASDVTFYGETAELNGNISGASDMKASELIAQNCNLIVDGASDVKLNITNHMKINASGASEIKFSNEPAINEITLSGAATANERSAIGAEVGNVNDTINIGQRVFVVTDDNEDEEEDWGFNGHWAGVDLMFNNFLNTNNLMEVPASYSFLEPEFNKSLGVQFNIFDNNFNLIRNKLGATTGLGLQFVNYRFANMVRLDNNANWIAGYNDTISESIKSKLNVTYLTVPLTLEFQTNNSNVSNSFHIAAGGFFGLRIGSHTKVVMDNGTGKDKYFSNDDFHLNPFKYGLTARIGWSKLNLFANYSLSTLFADGEGPDVYPIEFGLTLVGW